MPVVQFLLSRGADPDTAGSPGVLGQHLETPLLSAIYLKQWGMVEAMLQVGWGSVGWGEPGQVR